VAVGLTWDAGVLCVRSGVGISTAAMLISIGVAGGAQLEEMIAQTSAIQ
jgi:hypothetical protein